MKIEKLYTLSQFVDLISETDIEHENCYGNNELFEEAKQKCVSMVVLIADKIIAYNKKLKEFVTEDISDELILLDGVLIWKSEPIGGHFKDWSDINKVMTYEKLAEKTNGQLKIKPFEL